jgi:hypothetical protein
MDIDSLLELHPDLPSELAAAYGMYAATALERSGHCPGVSLALTVFGRSIGEALSWRVRSPDDVRMVDTNRVTEDGAECIALLVVGTHCQWTAVRRMQWRLGERADWIVEEASSGEQIAIEVSGTERGAFEPRIRQKLAQAEATPVVASRVAACMVRFADPKAELRTSHESRP